MVLYGMTCLHPGAPWDSKSAFAIQSVTSLRDETKESLSVFLIVVF
ncbi:hypothetical protein C5167_023442 [Papaver somniferum]|uniref:Uncharacterized protein n=1 Tax=Papaver somniferum TaxID=3469 RepID=A0A4Y7JM87_PAPSO|nr:hypothetical protein C5167_023442 [Papaver somniferum]